MNKNLVHDLTHEYRRAATHGPSLSENAYKGLDAHAKPGLHAFVAELAEEHLLREGRVLDCAAGSGALSLRLKDLGFQMSATDYVAENFRLKQDIPFHVLDLNQPFAERFESKFNAIVAAEIIEHLENPRHFLRECAKLLAPSGKLLLTTPNPDSPVSRTLLIRSGHTAWFSDADYKRHGHIVPVGIRMLRQCAAEVGFVVERLTSFGDAFDHCAKSPRLKLLAKLIEALDTTPKELRGDILVSVLRLDQGGSQPTGL